MSKKNILFIGGGNMAQAIIKGLIQQGHQPQHIFVVDRNQEKCQAFIEQYNVHATAHWQEFMMQADIILLAIKPQGAKELCLELNNALQNHKPLIISVMAGITLSKLNEWLGQQLAIVRSMPNTPSQIQLGATGLYANESCNEEDKNIVAALMQAIGITTWVNKEQDLDSITALSGSGPAYYFYFMECMQNAAIEMGIDLETARRFAIQTAHGAAKLALESSDDLATLRTKVTSKKGTTEAALNTMQEHHLADILKAAMDAACRRSKELSEMFN